MKHTMKKTTSGVTMFLIAAVITLIGSVISIQSASAETISKCVVNSCPAGQVPTIAGPTGPSGPAGPAGPQGPAGPVGAAGVCPDSCGAEGRAAYRVTVSASGTCGIATWTGHTSSSNVCVFSGPAPTDPVCDPGDYAMEQYPEGVPYSITSPGTMEGCFGGRPWTEPYATESNDFPDGRVPCTFSATRSCIRLIWEP